MINEIYINKKKIVGYETVKINRHYNRQFTLEDGSSVLSKNIKKKDILFKCSECSDLINRTLSPELLDDKKYLCRSCSLTGQRNPFYGKTHTDEFKKRLSDERKGVWLVGDENPMKRDDVKEKHLKSVNDESYKNHMGELHSGERNPFYGKTHTDETIELIIEKNKEWYNNLSDADYNELRSKMSEGQKRIMLENPTHYRRIKSKAARESHKSQFENMEMNGIERTVFNYLKNRNVNVKYSVILASYQFDFGIKDERILIEVDGDYWHGNPKLYNEDGSNGKRKLNEIQWNKKSKDIEKTKWAESRGFKLIRIWESEINDGTFKEKLNKL